MHTVVQMLEFLQPDGGNNSCNWGSKLITSQFRWELLKWGSTEAVSQWCSGLGSIFYNWPMQRWPLFGAQENMPTHLSVFVCAFMDNSYCIVHCLGGITAVLFRRHQASRVRYTRSNASTSAPGRLVGAALTSISLKLMCYARIYQKEFPSPVL